MARVCLLLTITTFVCLALTATTIDTHSMLTQHFDDGSQMIARIINEYLKSSDYAQLPPHQHEAMVKSDFTRFKENWVEKMISFVVEELQVDEESARMIRKNPSRFMINYETFKLLEFK